MKKKVVKVGKFVVAEVSKSQDDRWPDEETVAAFRKLTEDPNYDGGSWGPPLTNASNTDQAKYEICQMILGYKMDHKLLQKDIGERIGADESRVSEILRMRIDRFTLDRLIAYAEKLMPKLRVRISAK
jgi:predicted XRE-type DNA-binding protein